MLTSTNPSNNFNQVCSWSSPRHIESSVETPEHMNGQIVVPVNNRPKCMSGLNYKPQMPRRNSLAPKYMTECMDSMAKFNKGGSRMLRASTDPEHARSPQFKPVILGSKLSSRLGDFPVRTGVSRGELKSIFEHRKSTHLLKLPTPSIPQMANQDQAVTEEINSKVFSVKALKESLTLSNKTPILIKFDEFRSKMLDCSKKRGSILKTPDIPSKSRLKSRKVRFSGNKMVFEYYVPSKNREISES